MKFTIISLNDERAFYKEQIRQRVKLPEIELPAVNGSQVNLREEYEARELFTTGWGAKQGEAGVWLSNFDRWNLVSTMDEPLIVFEDDAIPSKRFSDDIEFMAKDLPDDWDYMSLWVPENQRVDYTYDVVYNEIGDPDVRGHLPYHKSLFKHTKLVAHVYQGYGMVALMYSPRGGQKLVDLAQRYGVYTPVDCFVYQQAHMGNLNGFAPAPIFANLVSYDWSAVSHVQLTERVEF